MKLSHIALMMGCLGLTSVFLVNCSPSSSPVLSTSLTATPTPSTSSTTGHQLYALVFEYNVSSGATIVGISGPYSNTASSGYTFSLPSPGANSYAIAGIFDTASGFTIPSSASTITPPASDYIQYYPGGCPVGGTAPSQTYTASTSGINLVMSNTTPNNGACVFGSGQSIQYSPLTGSSVVLSGSVTQNGL